jgi:hypothetical protein
VDAVARPMKRGGMPLEMDSNLQFRRDILVALAAFIIIALTAGASYFAFLKDKETYKRLTGQARADITRVYARREVDPTSGAERLVDISVTYKYQIAGQVHERTIRLGGAAANLYKEGGPGTVCYNPDNHEQAELFPADHQCGE